MCIAGWIWQAHPSYSFLLVLNRDEYHDRPTMEAGWWGDGTEKVLGGRDVQAGGTWLGCTRNGRLAFLTNVLEPDVSPDAKSRGDLPTNFLECAKSPLEYAEEVAAEAEKYNGFNLVVGDLCSRTMVYISNRPSRNPATIKPVTSGLHVLSNGGLDSPWHKALCLRMSFKDLLYKYNEEDVIPSRELVKQLMRDRVKADRDHLPNTGCSSEWEWNLSSVFVEVDTKGGRYGTRSTTVVAAKPNGDLEFYETYIEMGEWKEHTIQFQIEELKKN
ncbi:transport/golgi organization-like protein (DUF833) [Wolffia australiana]